MFIYNYNEKGLKKFEKDINDRIKEADSICITLEVECTKLSVDLTKEEVKELQPRINVYYSENGYSYVNFDLKKIFLGNVNLDDVVKVAYEYDCFDSVEHYHQIYLGYSNIIFEYHNELDKVIVKEDI